MKEDIDRILQFSLRVPEELFEKIGYIAEAEGRSKNKQIEQILIRFVLDYEQEHGYIMTRGERE